MEHPSRPPRMHRHSRCPCLILLLKKYVGLCFCANRGGCDQLCSYLLYFPLLGLILFCQYRVIQIDSTSTCVFRVSSYFKYTLSLIWKLFIPSSLYLCTKALHSHRHFQLQVMHQHTHGEGSVYRSMLLMIRDSHQRSPSTG